MWAPEQKKPGPHCESRQQSSVADLQLVVTQIFPAPHCASVEQPQPGPPHGAVVTRHFTPSQVA
jgi:hypothetical protein